MNYKQAQKIFFTATILVSLAYVPLRVFAVDGTPMSLDQQTAFTNRWGLRPPKTVEQAQAFTDAADSLAIKYTGTALSDGDIIAYSEAYTDRHIQELVALETAATGKFDWLTQSDIKTLENKLKSEKVDTTQAASVKDDASSPCSWYNLYCYLKEFLKWVLQTVARIFSVVTIIAGLALDIALKIGVLDLHSYLADNVAGGSNKLLDIWRVSRDFCNLFFIFILLYIGIGTMLRLKHIVGDWDKRVWAVLIAALLVNFSLPITRAAVDASNIVALQFYRQISHYAHDTKNDNDSSYGDLLSHFDQGVGGTFVTEVLKADPQKESEWKSPDNLLGKLDEIEKALATSAFEIVIFLVAASVLIFGAIVVLTRSVTIIFLVLLSPWPFVLYHFQKTKPYYEQYKDIFINQCLFLPAFVFMLYMGLRMVIVIQGVIANTGFISQVIGMIISIASLGLSVFVATELGAQGANFAKDWSRKLTGTGSGVAGAVASGLIKSPYNVYSGYKEQQKEDREAGRETGVARSLLAGGIKSIKDTATNIRSRVEADTGVDFSKPLTAQRLKDNATTVLQYGEGKVGQVFNAAAGTKEGFMPSSKEREEAVKNFQKGKVDEAKKKIRKEKLKADGKKLSDFLSTLDEKTQKSIYEEELSSFDRANIEDTLTQGGDTANLKKIQDLAKGIGKEEVEKIKNLREKIKKDREVEDGIQKIKEGKITENEIRQIVRKMGREIVKLDLETLKKKEVADSLNISQVDALQRNYDWENEDTDKNEIANNLNDDTKRKLQAKQYREDWGLTARSASQPPQPATSSGGGNYQLSPGGVYTRT